LLHFGHAQVTLGLIVGKRNGDRQAKPAPARHERARHRADS
jgi:hypothetical protein